MTDNISNQMVNTMEHVATKATDISLRSWWRIKHRILDIHQVAMNMLMNAYPDANRQLFASMFVILGIASMQEP